jgi:hypothetical protein
MKKLVLISIVFMLFLAVIELVLKYVWGFGDPVLYKADKNFEYIYAPNQNIIRFGNHIVTNEFSMRSLPVAESDTIRILKIGDSIVNGGSLTTHDSLATTILENELNNAFAQKIRVLNVSAGSWGPDNAFSYIQKYGSFNAKLMVLVFSSHDLYDTMEHEKIVDVDPSYPSKKPFSALTEVFKRYLFPTFESWLHLKTKNAKVATDNNLISFGKERINVGWNKFFHYAEEHKIKLLVVLHPTLAEIKMKGYDTNGQKILNLLDSAKIDRILELDNLPRKDLYRDEIHYNNKGQKFLARELYPYLKRFIQETYKVSMKR